MVELGRLEWLTCPPEKPTATTPSSLPAERNFGAIVEGEVMLRAYSRVFCKMGAALRRRSRDVRSTSIQQYRSEQFSCEARERRVSIWKTPVLCYVATMGYETSEKEEVKTVRFISQKHSSKRTKRLEKHCSY